MNAEKESNKSNIDLWLFVLHRRNGEYRYNLSGMIISIWSIVWLKMSNWSAHLIFVYVPCGYKTYQVLAREITASLWKGWIVLGDALSIQTKLLCSRVTTIDSYDCFLYFGWRGIRILRRILSLMSGFCSMEIYRVSRETRNQQKSIEISNVGCK